MVEPTVRTTLALSVDVAALLDRLVRETESTKTAIISEAIRLLAEQRLSHP